MERPGLLAAFGKTLVAYLRSRELTPGALLGLHGANAKQPQIIRRTAAFLSLHEENRRISAHYFKEMRLHVPGVRNDDIIRTNESTAARNRCRIVGSFHSLSANSIASLATRPLPVTRPMPQAGNRA